MDARRASRTQAGQRDAGDARVTSADERRAALTAVSGYLRCPVCLDPVVLNGGQLGCGLGHRFDIAKQGYVNLTAGRPGAGTADSAEMVASRDEFLRRGHYRPLAEAVAEAAARHCEDRLGADRPRDGHGKPALVDLPRLVDLPGLVGLPGLVVDLAGGTGYYLCAVLEWLPAGWYGACLDLSVPALRRAARVHPRAAAIGADAWRPLPLADRSASIVLSVFGPRNAAEISRVLAPGGTLIIASPSPGHLDELRGPLGMISVDERKSERIADAYGDYAQAGIATVNYQLNLEHDDVAALVAMGPSARHISPEALTDRIRALPSPVAVTVEVQVRALQRPS